MKKTPEKPANSERWLLTYSDLITLLMIFFIVMYSMSNLDAQKYAKLSGSLHSSMGTSKSMIDLGGSDAKNVKPIDTVDVPTGDGNGKSDGAKTDDTKKNLEAYLKQNGLSGSVSVSSQERGLVVSIQDSFFFEEGKADINTNMEAKLTGLGKILSTMDNYIIVEGNTDNVPISNSQFKDNWDLAYGRAANVMRLLINKCGMQSEKISPRSNGEYRSVANNSSEEGRQKNRRVDIVVLDSKYNKTETNTSK